MSSFQKITERLTHLIVEGEELFQLYNNGNLGFAGNQRLTKWLVNCPSAFDFIFGKDSIYKEKFNGKYSRLHNIDIQNVRIGIVKAALEDVQEGYLTKLETLVSADIFADFLEMAEHLLEKGYKDPAAVLIGGVLEEHLRKLCAANDIEITNADGKPVRADKMNADLAKASVYDKLQHKAVTYWLGLRNHAAHGEYDKYDDKEVRQMLVGVTDFASKYQP